MTDKNYRIGTKIAVPKLDIKDHRRDDLMFYLLISTARIGLLQIWVFQISRTGRTNSMI